MLYRFLKLVQASEIQSLFDLSRALGISMDMVLRMAQELSSRGYLQEMDLNCGETNNSCHDCSAGRSCQVFSRSWILTQKGIAAVSAQ
jgi:hypothetical protein